MQSVTKRKLDVEQIRMLVRKAFGSDTVVNEIRELTDGYFNMSYYLSMSNGIDTVLKVAPLNDVRVLRYEYGLMKTEVFVLKELAGLESVPCPVVQHYDESKTILDSEYFFMSCLEGTPLNKVKDKITCEQYDRLVSTLGVYAREISRIEGAYFGFINNKSKRYRTWYECFLSMVTDLLDDAEDVGLELPVQRQHALDIVKKNQALLNAVQIPSLVHKDLWEGNVFVDSRDYEITGIIDCERAIFGDKLMEAACGFLDENSNFMKSFLGRDQLSPGESDRIHLYKFYLFLLMVVECPYRRYEDEGMEKWARNRLEEVLLILLENGL